MTTTAEANSVQPPEGLCKLPLFRPIALKMLKVVSQEDVEFAAIASLLQSDPGFAAEVLALANSPMWGMLQQVNSLMRAIVVLGLERMKALAMTVALQSFARNLQDTREIQNCWIHSLAAALVAEGFAPLYGIARDHAYTAGLMHDLGRLGLLKAYPAQYSAVLTKTHNSQMAVNESERQLFQVDHCQAGGWLAKTWAFPEEFRSVAEHHHDAGSGRARIIGLSALACQAADALGFRAVQCEECPQIEQLLEQSPGRGRGLSCEELREKILSKVQSLPYG